MSCGTCRLADFRTGGLADLRTNGSRVCEGVLLIMEAGRGSGGHRPPPRWQVTVKECQERPVQRTPSGSFRAHATSANHHARVARVSRENGHTAIAGGRCLDAGIMLPPRSSESPDHQSVVFMKTASVGIVEDGGLRTCGRADLRTGGRADGRTGSRTRQGWRDRCT